MSATARGRAKWSAFNRPVLGGEGVLVGALQSERVEETRDRAERGSVVRGSDRASVAPKRTPAPTDRAAIPDEHYCVAPTLTGLPASGEDGRDGVRAGLSACGTVDTMPCSSHA